MTTSREIVSKAVRLDYPGRVPRDCWVLPWAEARYARELATIREMFPWDFAEADVRLKRLPHMKGDIYKRGKHVDDWGCRFMNLENGIIGEVNNE